MLVLNHFTGPFNIGSVIYAIDTEILINHGDYHLTSIFCSYQQFIDRDGLPVE